LRALGEGGLRLAGLAVGGAFFLLVVVGGGVYRTDCVTSTGAHEKSWRLGDTIPYLTGAHEGCEQHSLTRYALGKVGVMSDVERTYDATFIRVIASGSTVLASVVPAMHAAQDAPGNFNAADLQQPENLLLRGELEKMTSLDFSRLEEANAHSARYAAKVIATLAHVKASVLAQRVEPSTETGLTNGERRFAQAWNAYLASYGRLVDAIGLASSVRAPAVSEFRALIAAARRRSPQVKALRRSVLEHAVRLVGNLEQAKKSMRAQFEPAAQALDALVKTDPEARAIVEQVNRQYPHGELAEQFKSL
jgi:hypothetical protein